MSCPRLVTGARLGLCDGERSLEDIIVAMTERYHGSDVSDDVRELVDGMTQRGLLVDGDP